MIFYKYENLYCLRFLTMSSLTFPLWTLCSCGDVVLSSRGWCGLTGKRIVQGSSINEGKRLVCSVRLKIMSIFPQSQCWERNEMRLSCCDSAALPWRGRRLRADDLTQPGTGTVRARVSGFCLLLWDSLLCLWRAYLQSTLFGNALILKFSLVSFARLYFGFQAPLYFLRRLHSVHSP